MSQQETQYPNLRELYRDRIEVVKHRHLDNLMMAAVIAIGSFFLGGIHSEQGVIFLVVASAATIYFALRMISLVKGGKTLDEIWEGKVSEITDANKLALFDQVEAELYGDKTYYTDVGFTENYLILFREFGSFYRIKDIRFVYISEYASRTDRYGLFDAKSVYTFGCGLPGSAQVILANDEEEIREIFFEIRSRHPEVTLTREARAYFFPPSMLVE
jgi:hypothetical protein